MSVPAGDPVKRFKSYIDKTPGFGPNGDCWRWTGTPDHKGYGVFGLTHRKQVFAHRYSFFLAYGKWPEPCGLHKCDTPLCVRPDHIFEGTKGDNNRDRTAKGRTASGLRNGHYTRPERTPRGEDHPNAHLNNQTVRAVRLAWANHEGTQKQIGKRFGTTATVVAHCVNHRTL